ncbi:MAG: recombination regulator RecX, partial [Gammaproteobacteria bacterium]
MELLSRREHSTYQLTQKLRKRDFDLDEIEAALDRL